MGSVIDLPSTNAHVCRCGNKRSHGILVSGSNGSLWMYRNSFAESRGYSCGRLYSRSHRTSHVALKIPVKRNAHRQPRCTAIHGTVSGATRAPMFVPELKMPVASARSFLGNHSVTVF